ncbi:hypothetical protein ACFVXE_27385 [Streptomyces sp. NPDC058231]
MDGGDVTIDGIGAGALPVGFGSTLDRAPLVCERLQINGRAVILPHS